MGGEVGEFVAGIGSAKRRRDAETLLVLFERATGCPPRLWGSIVGFGEYHYRYPSGREGDAPAAAFAPRSAATSIYVSDGVDAYAEELGRLGPHSRGVGCVYLKSLDPVDLTVLEEIVHRSYRTLTSGTYTKRAREGGDRK